MVEGKSIITFGYDTTFMLGGSGTYGDDPAVALYFTILTLLWYLKRRIVLIG